MLVVREMGRYRMGDLPINRIVGGSKETFWNWLKGARLSRPSLPVVLIHPMGLGITKDLNGS